MASIPEHARPRPRPELHGHGLRPSPWDPDSRADADGAGASFRIAAAGSGTALGHIGVNEIHPVLRRGLIGHWGLPEARGRGWPSGRCCSPRTGP
ncbi:hypothetical protein SUDANB15_03265 [Streptomyces sp. enrichment culture]